jgi:hypothetical protein
LKRLDRAIDRVVDRVILLISRKASGRAVAALVVILYGGVGLALPIATGAPTSTLVGLNILGAGMAMAVVLAYFLGLVEARDRRHLVEWTTDLRLLDSEEFEWFVGEVFRREGWQGEQTGRRDGPDGGVDLRLRRGPEQRLVQCKRWSSRQVGVDDVRAFAGTLMREGLRGADGIFAALSGFTPQAAEEAARVAVSLRDGRDLYRMAEAVRRPDPCPACGAPMVLGRSAHGWWFRCVERGCPGKRDLGKDPGRAVELLTDVR